MKQIHYQQNSIYANTRPLGILGTIAAAIGLIVAAVFGAMFFLLLLGVMLVAGLIIAARICWTSRALRAELRRSGASISESLRQQAQQQPPGNTEGPAWQTIEGEYKEVDR